MHRIDGDGHAANLFTEGTPGVTPATQITDDWLNAVQEELCGVVTATGAALAKGNNGQLLTALDARYGRVGSANTWSALQTFNALPAVATAGGTRSFLVTFDEMYAEYTNFSKTADFSAFEWASGSISNDSNRLNATPRVAMRLRLPVGAILLSVEAVVAQTHDSGTTISLGGATVYRNTWGSPNYARNATAVATPGSTSAASGARVVIPSTVVTAGTSSNTALGADEFFSAYIQGPNILSTSWRVYGLRGTYRQTVLGPTF